MDSVATSGRKTRHLLRHQCQVVRERDFRLIADRIEDLSVTGLAVSPAEPVLTGERLIVSFRLPRVGTWIDVEARVARVIHGRRPGEDQRSLGLVFETISDESRSDIARELRSVPPAPPGRSQRNDYGERVTRVLAWLSSRIEPSWQY